MISEKTYMYRILNSNTPDPFLKNYAFFYPVKLDVEKMKDATSEIIGTRDFKSFMASGGQVKSTVRTVKEISIEKKNDIIEIYVTADGFLYNMVRIITGTLIAIGNGKITKEDIKNAIINKKREELGVTVPPCGLFMYDIKYKEV